MSVLSSSPQSRQLDTTTSVNNSDIQDLKDCDDDDDDDDDEGGGKLIIVEHTDATAEDLEGEKEAIATIASLAPAPGEIYYGNELKVLTLDLTAVVEEEEDNELMILDDQEQIPLNNLKVPVIELDDLPLPADDQHTTPNSDHCYVFPSKDVLSSRKELNATAIKPLPRRSQSSRAASTVDKENNCSSHQGFYVPHKKCAQTIAAAALHRRRPRSPPKFTFRIIIGSSTGAATRSKVTEQNAAQKQIRQNSKRRRAEKMHRERAPAVQNAWAVQEIDLFDKTADFDVKRPQGRERNVHNHMERQRRIELKNAFTQLQRFLPNIGEEEKVSKVKILHQAIKFCRSLKAREERLRLQHQLLIQRKDMLGKRLVRHHSKNIFGRLS